MIYNNNNNGINHIKDKHSSTINSDSSHYLAHAFNSSFLNIQLKFQQQRKLKASLNPLNVKIHVDMKYSLNYLKSALLLLPHLKVTYVIHPFYQGPFLNA
jgi:hypothetical protein